MLKIDGSYGEGGGQIIRTALTLSCITQTPILLHNIRAGRAQGGLRPQHLMCVHAASDIVAAEVDGAYVGSEKLTFTPTSPVKAGKYFWDIRTAGSVSLVMQTVLLALGMANGESEVTIVGGTNVPMSPTAHYIRDVYVPMLVQSGMEVIVSVDRLGWYPRGGGQINAMIEGWAQLQGQDLAERGELERIFGEGVASNLPAHIPHRIATRAQKVLEYIDTALDIRPHRDGTALGKGAAMHLVAEYANGRAGFTCLGEQGYPSEKVADEATSVLELFHMGNASVDEHLADQLLLVLALADGESRFITPIVTEHLRTNLWVVQQFLNRPIQIDENTGLVNIE